MRVVIAAALLLTVAAGSAQALTIRDVIELTRAGLTDEVLLALIAVDGGVYASDIETLKALKEAGVSERVMVALVRSGRERRTEEPPPMALPAEETPPPPVVVIEHHEPQVQQVVVPVPVYIPVYATPSRGRHGDDFTRRVEIRDTSYVPFQPGLPVIRDPEPRAEERSRPPVYWGFGGKLRPDAWGQPGPDRDKPADKDGKPAPK